MTVQHITIEILLSYSLSSVHVVPIAYACCRTPQRALEFIKIFFYTDKKCGCCQRWNAAMWQVWFDYFFLSWVAVVCVWGVLIGADLVKTGMCLSWKTYFVITSSWTPICFNSSLSAAYVFPTAFRHIFMLQISLLWQKGTDETAQFVTYLSTLCFSAQN